MQEVWKDIPGYEGLYQASSMGRIRSVEGKVTHSTMHGVRHWHSRILKQKQTKDKCFRVTLWKDKTPKGWLVHRLVAMAFLGLPPEEKYTVNHKDGNRENNCVDNLEWLSLADNIRHGFDNGLYPKKEIVLQKDGERFRFSSYAEASRFLGRNQGYVSNSIKRNGTIKDKDGLRYEVISA